MRRETDKMDGKSLASSPCPNRPNQLTYESFRRFPSLSSLIGSLRETRGVTSRLVHVGVGLFRTTTTTTESCGYLRRQVSKFIIRASRPSSHTSTTDPTDHHKLPVKHIHSSTPDVQIHQLLSNITITIPPNLTFQSTHSFTADAFSF